MNKLVEIEPEYIYITIPAEYICVYHRILAMLADYGEEMLKDCKASCTDRNSNIIECFNMFNAAVAARKLGNDKLAELLIKYIKEKINIIYKGKDNSTSFVFPIDENGEIKAFVSCDERVKFEIKPENMNLYEHKYGDGVTQHFVLSKTDTETKEDNYTTTENKGLKVIMIPRYEKHNGFICACCDIKITYDDKELDQSEYTIDYYIDEIQVDSFLTLCNVEINETHTFMTVVKYKDEVAINEETITYGDTN